MTDRIQSNHRTHDPPIPFFPKGPPVNILLANDDGIFAPGLRALRQELQKLGKVTVGALPDSVSFNSDGKKCQGEE